MTEYIEREAVIKALKENITEMESDIYFGSNKGVPEDDIDDIVNEIPVADVVKVVKCKNCKYLLQDLSERKTHICMQNPYTRRNVNRNDYCSYGEEMEARKC